jgi:hypothetical protein
MTGTEKEKPSKKVPEKPKKPKVAKPKHDNTGPKKPHVKKLF